MKGILKYVALMSGAVCMAMACTGNVDNPDLPGEEPGTGTYEELDVQYYKQLLCTEFTAAACINCPTMAALLDEVDQQRPGLFAMTALHVPYAGKVDELYIPMAQTYANRFNVTGLPTGIIDLRPDKEFVANKDSFEKTVSKELAEHPAMCGVAIDSEYDESDRSLAVTVKVTSNKHIAYRYLIMLTESNVNGYNYSVRSVLANNIYGERLNKGTALIPGTETAGTRKVELGADWNIGNMKIVAAALVSEDNGVTWVCDNVAICGVGESVDYRYVNE